VSHGGQQHRNHGSPTTLKSVFPGRNGLPTSPTTDRLLNPLYAHRDGGDDHAECDPPKQDADEHADRVRRRRAPRAAPPASVGRARARAAGRSRPGWLRPRRRRIRSRRRAPRARPSRAGRGLRRPTPTRAARPPASAIVDVGASAEIPTPIPSRATATATVANRNHANVGQPASPYSRSSSRPGTPKPSITADPRTAARPANTRSLSRRARPGVSGRHRDARARPRRRPRRGRTPAPPAGRGTSPARRSSRPPARNQSARLRNR